MPNQLTADYVRAIGRAVQLFQEATEAFDNAAAEVLGVNRTDLKCLGVLHRLGPIGAGDLAKATGLTKGAMTTALDRIERVGYARRTRDPADRRGVIIELTDQGRHAIATIWGPLEQLGQEFLDQYSPAELDVVLRFLEQARAAQLENMARLRRLEADDR